MPEKESSNVFLSTLQELQAGATLTDLHHALKELVGEVRSIGKKGTLSLTITVAPKQNSAQLVISDEIKVAAPKPDRDITILFADDNNYLSRRDPRQPRLAGVDADVRQFARPVAVNEAPANVNPSTGEIHEP